MSYKDNPNVAMFLVYVREAHPVKEADAPKESDAGKPKGPGNITQHKTIDDRIVAASACMEGLKLTLPVLIDTMDGVVEKAYKGVPAAMVIVDLEGNVVSYAHGPTAVQPAEAEKVLKRLLGEKPNAAAGQ